MLPPYGTADHAGTAQATPLYDAVHTDRDRTFSTLSPERAMGGPAPCRKVSLKPHHANGRENPCLWSAIERTKRQLAVSSPHCQAPLGPPDRVANWQAGS